MEALKYYPEVVSAKKKKSGYCPITIRFDWNGDRAGNESIDLEIKVEDWDQKARRAKDTDANFELINLVIENRLNKHRNYFTRRKAFSLPISKELIRKYVKSGSGLEDFYEYAEQVLQHKKLKDGLPYSEETKRRYRDEIKKMMQFSPTLSFSKLNEKFLVDYRSWLLNTYVKADGKRMEVNGAWNAFKFIRMVYNEATKESLVLPESNPFNTFQVGTYQTDTSKIKYLEKSDVDALEKILTERQDLPDLMARVGWRFLSMCVCGMRISDAMMINEGSFNDAGDLAFKPHKTRRHGNQAQVPIISDRQRLYLQKTLSLPLPPTDFKSFRTTFNIQLKILAAMAGITINLTSHVGRHTMGSFLVDAGIETKSAMAMLGVKSEKVMQTYLHLKESKLRSEANKLKNVF